MRRIGIDCRLSATGTGLARYIRELIPSLISRHRAPWTLFVDPRDTSWIPDDADTAVIGAPYARYGIREQTSFPLLLGRSHIDLLFVPHFNVPLLSPVPFVSTIHDLILHRFPNAAPAWKRAAYRFTMRSTVQRAQTIIAVSQFTAREIASHFGPRTMSRTVVIPEAAHQRFQRVPMGRAESVLRTYGLRRPFFLYVGNAKEHKNVPMLLRAFVRSGMSRTHDLALLMSGREADSIRIPDGVRRLLRVPDSELPSLLSCATALVSASLYEGFFLPMAEAHACGCPVIAVRGSAVSEEAETFDVLVDADEGALADALKTPPRVPDGRHRTRSWEDVSDATAKVLFDTPPDVR